ncbi:hypothetical protein PBI_VALIDUS_40 [Mycobacterium phage Validus]|uniref:Uncharacterized protein n=1 Tax=Mycobacterium phage Validus TaxID=1414747 RepID=V5UQ99_9CAUD|nr:hypothetical protein CC50_gp071 [Mycobacterium phage Validus]AHB79570.1 hypothetical protein PBI_VALIDUS_40 [Mycobacterium phage Validus]
MAINTTYPYTCSRGTINGREVPAGYMDEAADARELAAFDDRLSEGEYRTLQSAIRSGLPVVLVTRDGDKLMRRTVVVEYATIHPRSAADPTAGSGNLIRVAYWGFGHNVWLQDIVSIDTPDVEYLDVPEVD